MDELIYPARTIGMKTMANGATRLTVEFDTEIRKEMEGIWTSFASPGQTVAVALLTQETGQQEQRRQTIAKEEPSEPSYGHLAKVLRQSGILTHLDVVTRLGSDNEYQAWCRSCRCAVTGEFDWDAEKGEARCEYAHVRRADQSGTGIKPLYSGLPLMHSVHHLQHMQGELAVLRRFPPSTPIKDEIAAHAWFNRKAQDSLHRWAWERLKENLGAESMRLVSPGQLTYWFESQGIGHLCPLDIRQAADKNE